MNDSVPSPPRPDPGQVMRAPGAAGRGGWLPGLQILRQYELGWLRHDIAAGLVLTTMLVPVGIAYAVASGVPGIYGLYASIVPLLAYALFGPSRILVLGPDSSLAALILAVVLAIVIAVIEFLWDGWRPHSAVLGRVDGIKGYHDITRYPDARLIPGLVLFRWDASLFFANAEFFQERVMDAVAASPTPVRWLVVAAEPVTSVDVTAADALAELDEPFMRRGSSCALPR